MYTREIQAERDTPLEGGLPLHGTWAKAFRHVDLSEIQRPFAVPLPPALVDARIKEWLSFSVQNGDLFLHAFLYNFKFFRGAEVLVWHRESGEFLRFRKILPFTGWRLPRSLSNALVESRSYGFYFRVHTWLDARSIRVDLNIAATKKRPSFTAHLAFDSGGISPPTPMAVSLLFSGRRSMYAYKAATPVRGELAFGGKQIHLNPSECSGLFGDFKGFFPYNTRALWVTGMGFGSVLPPAPEPGTEAPAPDGVTAGDTAGGAASPPARIAFNIAETQCREPNRSNENALWVDGELSPLPPVKITMPGGIENGWIIQDLEGMVDLAFTPEKPVSSSANIAILRAEYDTPIGYFNGMLLNSKGERIPVKNMRGMGERLRLRV